MEEVYVKGSSIKDVRKEGEEGVATNADKSGQGGGGVLPYADVRVVRPLNDLVADDCGTGTAKQDADCQMTSTATISRRQL